MNMTPAVIVKYASWSALVSLLAWPLCLAAGAVFAPVGLLAAVLATALSLGGLIRLRDRRCLLVSVLSGIALLLWTAVVIANSTVDMMPNKSPEPNPISALGQSRAPVAHLVIGSGWLSFLR